MKCKNNVSTTTVTRNLNDFGEKTGNVYESVAIIGKRANQITTQIKEELNKKLKEFGTKNDSLDEEFENREQIEISRYYERMPKPTLIATEEFLNDEINYRNLREERDKF